MPGKKAFKTKPLEGIIERRPYQNPNHPPQPVEPRAPDEGRVSYISTNNHDGSTFQADCSENSPLAGRLLKLALQNQPEYKKPKSKPISRERLEGQRQQLLTAHGEPAPQPLGIASPSYTPPTQQPDYPSSTQYPSYAPPASYPAYTSSAPSQQGAYTPYTGIDPQHPHQYTNPIGPSIPQQNQRYLPASGAPYQLSRVDPAPPPSPLEIYRYEHDGQIEYAKRAPGGELRISAPTESHEARAMDYAAAQLCVGQEGRRDQVS